MVSLFFCDKDFVLLGVVNDFSSLQWFEKWYSVGTFEIHADFLHTELFKNTAYVYRNDTIYTGAVGVFGYTDTSVYVKGAMLEQILEHSPIVGNVILEGLGGDIIRRIIEQYCISPPDAGFKVARLQMGAGAGLGAQTRIELENDTVLTAIQTIALEQGLSFNMRYEEKQDIIFFDVLQGLDRTQEQGVNTWCLFTTETRNIISDKYEENKYIKNYAIVLGGSPPDVVRVDVDQVPPGEMRKTIIVTESSLKQDEQTLAQYQEVLRNRGLQVLAENAVIKTIEPEIDEHRVMSFSLGDLCSYVNHRTGITAIERVVEVQQIIESKRAPKKKIVLGREAQTLKG